MCQGPESNRCVLSEQQRRQGSEAAVIMDEVRKYSIGDMAKLCGIPARQLRYYDQIGLVKPNYRNPDTGYRYYTEDQMEMLFFLKELKNIGISNDSMQRVVINRDVDQMVEELQLNLTLVEQEIQAALTKYRNIVNALVLNTKALAYLNGQEAIDSDEYGYYWIRVHRIPEMKVLYRRYEGSTQAENRNDYPGRVIDLSRTAEDKGIKLAETKMSIWHGYSIEDMISGNMNAEGTYEIAREIKEHTIADDGECIKTIGGFNAICTINNGDASTFRDAYATIQKWAENHNIAISDVMMEEYLTDTFLTMDKSRHSTRVIVPIVEM